jgi:hypothetical protein
LAGGHAGIAAACGTTPAERHADETGQRILDSSLIKRSISSNAPLKHAASPRKIRILALTASL